MLIIIVVKLKLNDCNQLPNHKYDNSVVIINPIKFHKIAL